MTTAPQAAAAVGLRMWMRKGEVPRVMSLLRAEGREEEANVDTVTKDYMIAGGLIFNCWRALFGNRAAETDQETVTVYANLFGNRAAGKRPRGFHSVC